MDAVFGTYNAAVALLAGSALVGRSGRLTVYEGVASARRSPYTTAPTTVQRPHNWGVSVRKRLGY